MKRTLVALAAIASVLAPTAASAGYADPVFPRGLAYAQNESECAGAYRCVWDARHQGNGTGQSLILTRYQGGYLMAPIGHRRAHWLHAKYCGRQSVDCGY